MIKIVYDTKEEKNNILDTLADRDSGCPIPSIYCDNSNGCRKCLKKNIKWKKRKSKKSMETENM